MKVTSVEIHAKPGLEIIPGETPEITEQHWYLGSTSSNQELPGTTHQTYDNAANHTAGGMYVSTVQDEGLSIGQSFSHFTAPPAVPYEVDAWECFQSFIDLDTTSLLTMPLSAKLRLYLDSGTDFVLDQQLLAAPYTWTDAIAESDWHTPADLSALTPIGSADIGPSTSGFIEIALDPSALVLGGHTQLILYTSELRDGNSPGGPGPTGSIHSVTDFVFLGPNPGGGYPTPPAFILPDTDTVPTIPEGLIVLSFRDPRALNPYTIKNIDGLDADTIIPNFIGISDISRFFSLLLKPRKIVVQTGLNPDFANRETYSDLRDALYRIIAASRNGEVQLQFKNQDEVVAAISGFVSKVEADLFEKLLQVNLSIDCKDAMLRSLDRVPFNVATLNTTSTVITDDKSTSPHGFTAVLRFLGSVSGLTFSNNELGFALTIRPKDAFVPGDLLYYSSEFDNKYLYRVRGGQVLHLGDRIDLNSIWPILFPGENTFQLNSPTLVAWNEVAHYETYWGV